VGIPEKVTSIGQAAATFDLLARNPSVAEARQGGAFLDLGTLISFDGVQVDPRAILIVHQEIRYMWSDLGFELDREAEPRNDMRVYVENAA
jgi:hypothetical protein